MVCAQSGSEYIDVSLVSAALFHKCTVPVLREGNGELNAAYTQEAHTVSRDDFFSVKAARSL